MSEKFAVTKITVQIGEVSVEMTPEQARELRDSLITLLPLPTAERIRERERLVPVPYPVPAMPVRPWPPPVEPYYPRMTWGGSSEARTATIDVSAR